MENVFVGTKLDEPWNEMWTMNLFEVFCAAALGKPVTDPWMGSSLLCLHRTQDRHGKISSSFLYYPDCSSGALCTQRWGGYCRKRYCSISHKSSKAQPSLLLYSPKIISPALYEIPSEIFSLMAHFCCTLSALFSTQPNSYLNVSSLQIPFSCYIQKKKM